MRCCLGESVLFIPINIMPTHMGMSMCKVLSALHCLAGCDYTGKIGTKAAAIKISHSKKYLS